MKAFTGSSLGLYDHQIDVILHVCAILTLDMFDGCHSRSDRCGESNLGYAVHSLEFWW
jgi:hypothetical protein